MANDHEAVASRQIRRLFGGGVTGTLADGELLRRFLAHDGQAAEFAFASLVERHGPMVRRVARSILLDSHDTDDAFQATFLVLARKAGSLRVADSLGPWLHGVTCRVAASVRSAKIRRRYKERRVGEGAPTSITERVGDDLSSILHEEIDRLPNRYSAPVVLCLFEGLTQEQAAHCLGWPSGTVRSRLARGRHLLQSRLTRRGLAPATVLIGASAAPEAVAAASVESATRAALDYLSGSPSAAVVSASVIELTSTVLRSLFMSRIKVAAILLLTACVGAAGFQAFARQRQDDQPAAAKVPPGKSIVARPDDRTATTKIQPPNARGVWWKYQSVRLVNESQLADKANEEAPKGWEVVEVVPVIQGINGNLNTQYTILFRRPTDGRD
jgi:RNA polymerase sigma factor (sigma-70 family)